MKSRCDVLSISWLNAFPEVPKTRTDRASVFLWRRPGCQETRTVDRPDLSKAAAEGLPVGCTATLCAENEFTPCCTAACAADVSDARVSPA